MAHRSVDDLPPSAADHPAFRLGPWLVQPALNRISADGRSETLEPRMTHVLVCLAACPGEVLSRGLLLDAVWGETIVGEETLTRAVSRLRDLLGDATRRPRYIETIRGGGYRLLLRPEPATPLSLPTGAAPRRRPWPALALLAAVVVAVALGLTWRLRPAAPAAVAPRVAPFTALPGNEGYPAFAPDGRTVVFSWNNPAAGTAGLYLQRRDSDRPSRLTDSPGTDYLPAVAPDGSAVAFVRRGPAGRGLYTVPLPGGEPRLLLAAPSPIFGLGWTPDGRHLIFAGADSAEGVYRIRRLETATLELTDLTAPDPRTHTGDSWPLVSPDGGMLVYARCDHAGLRDLWRKDLPDGPERRLTDGLKNVDGLAWLVGGRQLVVAAAPQGDPGLWRVDVGSGAVAPLGAHLRGTPMHPAVSPDGATLVVRCVERTLALERVALDGAAGAVTRTVPFVPSTRSDQRPAWSPDGAWAAFVSDRSGDLEVWLAAADGSQLRRLSAWAGPDVRTPQWSPDGTTLAVTLEDAAGSWVELVDVAAGRTRTLMRDDRHVRVCGWTAADTLLVLRDEGAAWRLRAVGPDGVPGRARELVLSGHPLAMTAPDGVWFQDPRRPGLWRLPADGGAAVLMVSAEQMAGWRAWVPLRGAVWCVRARAEGAPVLAVLVPGAARPRELGVLPDLAIDLAVAPAGDVVLVTRLAELTADLQVVDLPAGR